MICTSLFHSFSLQPALSSYLGYPRINFFGNFRGDSNTQNNDVCNYRPDVPIDQNIDTVNWNINGTNEFEFVNTRVTSVLNKDGNTPDTDALIGRSIIGNLGRPLAKLSDGSSREPEVFTIFGMKFGVKWTDKFPKTPDDIAFHGDCSRGILTQFNWNRIPCYTEENNGSEYSFQNSIRQAPQFTITVSNIEWGNLDLKSEVLNQLHDIVGDGGKLSVRITLFYTTRNFWPYVAHNATLGYVIGTVGVHDKYDTTNVPGKRAMFPKHPPVLPHFPPGDICSTYRGDYYDLQWTNFAPFEIGTKNDMPEVRLDLSNSLPADLSNAIRDLGTLKLGVRSRYSGFPFHHSCVFILSEDPLPYINGDKFFPWIFSVPFDPIHKEMVEENPLVLVQVLESDEECTVDDIYMDEICTLPKHQHRIRIILEEYPYFIRPMGYYVDFLEREHNPTSFQSVYVTRYGQPVQGIELVARQFDPNGPPVYGVVPISRTVQTGEDGVANFTFRWNGGHSEVTRIPENRTYYKYPCLPNDTKHTLPIDGQLYYFYYCINSAEVECSDYKYIPTFFLAFSELHYKEPLTWVDDVKVILSQYARVSPMMTKILDLSNYTEVVLLKDVMTMVLNITDLDDPAYMPTTRDLSLAKRYMILKWLENPLYNSTSKETGETEEPVCIPPDDTLPPPTAKDSAPFVPPEARCNRSLFFIDPPEKGDPRLRNIAILSPSNDQVPIYKPLVNCTTDNVKDRLQTAVQLEWATIPVYLTSLYSIVENCNFEIYELIWSVVIQEMLHMTQAANILIAMGTKPVIDNADFTPKFPSPGLPGGVLPGLNVTLERLSIRHIHDVFMSIEVPEHRLPGEELLTIGRFYNEIQRCIESDKLEDKDFQVSEQQVKWSWKDLVFVNSKETARKGIEMIVSQGEGTGLLSPLDFERDSVAHFYKFEEIVCGHRLNKTSDHTYKYNGPPIPYEQRGVWPMRANPDTLSIPYPSNCYTESRAFHEVYRRLLRKLQDMFDHARSTDVNVAIQLMESLEGHGKKLMWTKFHPDGPDNYEMCGPVWEYDWPDDIHIDPYP